MKKIILALLILFSFSANAQKDFEGMIKYKFVDNLSKDDENESKADTGIIRIFFTPGKILMKQEKQREKKEDILIILDSAKVYTLNREMRTYTAKRLRTMPVRSAPTKEVIAGYTATPLLSAGSMTFSMSGIMTWYADSLFFHIPQGLENNEEMMMINNNRILLKAQMNEGSYTDREWDDGNREEKKSDTAAIKLNFSFTLIATEITHGGINPADFVIPSDFTKKRYQEYYLQDIDTAIVMVDSLTVTPPPPPPKQEKEKPAKQPAKPTTEKSPVRKQDQ